MKKMVIFIFLILQFIIVLPASTKQNTTQSMTKAASQIIYSHFTKPFTDYIESKPILRSISNFYTNPKYEKTHSLIYAIKSPNYQEQYYNPALKWLHDYWRDRVSDHFIDYHRNTMDPIIKSLQSSDKTKHANKISDYYHAYSQYHSATTQQEKLKSQRNLFEKINSLKDALEESPESKLHAR